MFKRTALIGMFLMAALAQSGFAAVNTVAGLANPLDNAGASARALAMGSAFVGVADDSAALFWNPAGLAGLKKTEIALHHNSWLAGIIQETGVLGLPLGSLGGLGVSGNFVNYGAVPGYDEAGTQVSDYSANRYGLGAGWGLQVMPGLFAGLAAKGTLQSVGDSNYAGLSADFGVLWSPVKHLRLGLAYYNLGTQLAGYSLASTLRAGGSYLFDVYEGHRLLLAASGAFEPQGVSRLQFGVEDVINSWLAIRAGYQASLADNQLQGLNGLTAGLGLMYEHFGLDYAWVPFGDLGEAHRLSLSYRFGAAHD